MTSYSSMACVSPVRALGGVQVGLLDSLAQCVADASSALQRLTKPTPAHPAQPLSQAAVALPNEAVSFRASQGIMWRADQVHQVLCQLKELKLALQVLRMALVSFAAHMFTLDFATHGHDALLLLRVSRCPTVQVLENASFTCAENELALLRCTVRAKQPLNQPQVSAM